MSGQQSIGRAAKRLHPWVHKYIITPFAIEALGYDWFSIYEANWINHNTWYNEHKEYIISLNTLRPRQNGHHFRDDIFKCIFLNENAWISIKISLKFVPKVQINIIPALVQIMAWRRPGDKPLSEPMMDNLLTHICVTRHGRVLDATAC